MGHDTLILVTSTGRRSRFAVVCSAPQPLRNAPLPPDLRSFAMTISRQIWVRFFGTLLTVAAFAQQPPHAGLVVTTHDLQGQPVPQATVTLEASPGNPPPGGKFTPRIQSANETGTVRFANLAPGRYLLNVVSKGFDELTTNIDVEVTDTGPDTIDAVLTPVGTRTDSITVQGEIETPLQEANTPAVLDREQVKNLPDRPRTVNDALTLAPGIVRLPTGQLVLSGSGEHRSTLLVNSATATDPATGQFGATVPIDSVRTINVLSSPFLAEYGGFTADVVSVETRKAGDKWKFELNDPLPEYRWRSWHMVGLRSATPRINFGGPLIKNRLYFLESVQYEMRSVPIITLSFPDNQSRHEGYNSLTAVDYIIDSSNVLDATFHVADQHIRYANLDYFNPEPLTPNTSDSSYSEQCRGALVFQGHSPRQRDLDDQFPRRSMAAGRSRHDTDAVDQRGKLFRAADAHLFAHRMARDLVAFPASPGDAQPEVRFRARRRPRNMR